MGWGKLGAWFAGRRPPSAEAAAAATPAAPPRFAEIGWLIDATTPSFIWDEPRPLPRGQPTEHPKGVNRCPAILDSEARTWEVLAPVDMHLRLGKNDKGEPSLVNVAGAQSSVAAGKLQQMITLMPQSRWRDQRRPVCAPSRAVPHSGGAQAAVLRRLPEADRGGSPRSLRPLYQRQGASQAALRRRSWATPLGAARPTGVAGRQGRAPVAAAGARWLVRSGRARCPARLAHQERPARG